MLFSTARLLLFLAVSTLATPVLAQQKGYTVTWTVTIKQPGEVQGTEGKVTRIEPNRTYKAVEILGPLKSGEIPPSEMEKLAGIKDPMAFMRITKDFKVAVPVKKRLDAPIVQYLFKDAYIETIPFKGEGGIVTADGQEGTIDGSGSGTYAGAGNTVTTLSYSISKKEYQIWLPFYAIFNGKPVNKTYYNFAIDANKVKTVKQPPAFQEKVDPAISATLVSPNKNEKIYPVFRVAGAMPLKVSQVVKLLYMFPTSGSNVPVPVNAVVDIIVKPIK